jgi:predicted transcriptional regulator
MSTKQFIFKYDPSASLKEMFKTFNEAWETGKPNIQPKNVLISNNLTAIYRTITLSRLEIFTCLLEKKPNNLTELSQLLKRDYANVWKDIRALEGLEIIKLKKIGKEIKPIALYNQIVFDFQSKRKLTNPVVSATI